MEELKIDSEEKLLKLAYCLGTPIPSRIGSPLIDNLIPLRKEVAHKQSLSANFGLGEFPFHTDGAYLRTPPRYIILRYVRGILNPTPTIFCDLKSINEFAKHELKFHVWKVKSRNASFYSNILSEDERIYRYDTCIMNPVNKNNSNAALFENLITSMPMQEVKWEENKTIVINNWTCVHKRPEVNNEEVNYRHLQRIMIL